jgi:hypothetical protein
LFPQPIYITSASPQSPSPIIRGRYNRPVVAAVPKVPRHKLKNNVRYFLCRSQWPRSLRNELSSPAQTLRSSVRIPLQAWMFVCFHSVFYYLCDGTFGTAATTGLLYQPQMVSDGDCGEIGGIKI